MSGKVKQFADASMEKVSSMEQRLSGAFKLVKPRREFVHGVAERIKAAPRASLHLVDRIANLHVIAVVVAGVISAAVFLAVVARALASLLGKKRVA
jgi:hypothetical protein